MAGKNDGTAVRIGVAFALGLAAGFLLKDAAKQLYERARVGQWHREVRADRHLRGEPSRAARTAGAGAAARAATLRGTAARVRRPSAEVMRPRARPLVRTIYSSGDRKRTVWPSA